jgi:hypothetical protein
MTNYMLILLITVFSTILEKVMHRKGMLTKYAVYTLTDSVF